MLMACHEVKKAQTFTDGVLKHKILICCTLDPYVEGSCELGVLVGCVDENA